MFGSQPAYPEKLLHKKESLQNQLINIRVELSQASTVMGGLGDLFVTSRVENKQGIPLGWLGTKQSEHPPGATSAPGSVSAVPWVPQSLSPPLPPCPQLGGLCWVPKTPLISSTVPSGPGKQHGRV